MVACVQGMRGKKNSIIADVENQLFPEETNKRAPMGFQGMRGKKASLDDEYYKRAPMGFQGMRGKKSLEEVGKQRTLNFEDHLKSVTRGKEILLFTRLHRFISPSFSFPLFTPVTSFNSP